MKKLALTLSIIFLAAGVSAHEFNPQELEPGNLGHFEEEMNIYSGEIPGLLSSIIGNQTINLRIENEEARDKEVGVKIEGAAVREMQMGGYPNATLRVETSVSQINEITTSDQPLQELNSALENGGIEYESNGAFNSLRMSFATQLLSVAAAM